METVCGGTGIKGGIEETRMRIHPPVFGDDFSMRVLIWSYTAGLTEMPVWEAYIFTQVFPAMFVTLNPASGDAAV